MTSIPDFEIGSFTDVGLKRKNDVNQDSSGVFFPARADLHHPLLVVADGMGGHGGGSTASRLVVEALKDGYQRITSLMALKDLENLVVHAHQVVYEEGAKDKQLSGMGSTVVAAIPYAGKIVVVNVGDSRLYRFRGNEITQLSVDQSWVGEQVRAGILTPEQIRNHPYKNRLTMSISAMRKDVKPYAIETDLGSDDIILLCSDGLWGTIPDSIIWAAATELPPQVAAEKLVALANTCQGPDNISVIIARRRGFTPNRNQITSMKDTNPG